MSFKLYTVEGLEVLNHPGGPITVPLTFPRTMFLEGVSPGHMLHNLVIEIKPAHIVQIVRAPGAFETKNVLVDSGPIENGPVITHLFNLSDEGLRIGKGDTVSWLMEL